MWARSLPVGSFSSLFTHSLLWSLTRSTIQYFQCLILVVFWTGYIWVFSLHLSTDSFSQIYHPGSLSKIFTGCWVPEWIHFQLCTLTYRLSHTRYELIPVSRQSARRWQVINPAVGCHYPLPCRRARHLWPVPNYTAWWQRHECEQLAQGRYMKVERPGFELATSGSRVQRPNHYTTTPHDPDVPLS